MEIDAKDWINDLERQTNQTVTKLAVLEQKVENNHDALLKNSDVRLATIMAGIAEIRNDRREDREEMLTARRRILAVAASIFTSVLTAAWFVILEPMQERMAVIERRLLDVEARTISVDVSDNPE